MMAMPSFDAVKGGKTHTVGSYEFHINFEHNIARMEWAELSGWEQRSLSEAFTSAQVKDVWDALPPTTTGGHSLVWLQTALTALQKELIFTIDGITKPE